MAEFMGYDLDDAILSDLLFFDWADSEHSVNGDDLAVLYRDDEDGCRNWYELHNGQVSPLRPGADGETYSLREPDDFEWRTGRLARVK